MERMTFYIPPVFLFGNKVRHNQEENKAEYKTAAETEIKVENWRVKRIDELEEENETLRDTNRDLQRWLKQTEDMLKFQQEENKKLREENEVLKEYKSMYEGLIVN